MWTSEWDKEKLRLAQEQCFSAGKGKKNASGKLRHPGKHLFWALASRCIRAISKKRDKDGVLYPRKAMIQCGLSLELDGLWQESQLSEHLQAIVQKYRDDFDGNWTE
ncbi:hypothetical protein PI124_g20980 [Phytophthora idaei]|nr:hypothetical protein PI124_g20980 [Phytophthora idaei]